VPYRFPSWSKITPPWGHTGTHTRTASLALSNCDLDSGKLTKAAEYSLTDDTYAKLLSRLCDKKFDSTPPDLRTDILSFHSDLSAPIETTKD